MAAIDLPYCDISAQESCSKLNRRLMSRGFFFFFFFYHHHIQLHLKVIDSLFTERFLPSCPEIPGVTAAARRLLRVTVRALAFSGTLADRGKPSSPEDSVWLF